MSKEEKGASVLEGAEGLSFFQLLQAKGAVQLECAGMRHSSGRSAVKFAKLKYKLKGNKHKVLAALEKMVEDAIAKKQAQQ